MSTTPPLAPAVVAELRQLARTELSMRARVAYVLLALAASAMTIVIASLWMTEPALPLRTRIAFAVLTSIGIGWVTFSVWVLRSKHVLLARHRVVAGRLAASFSSIFVVGCIILGFASSSRAAWSALAMGVALLVIAIVLWRRAEATHARLLARRNTLERELDWRTR
jgi:hypothetical protein